MADNLPSLAPRTFQEAQEFANVLAESSWVPDAYKKKPNDILIAMQMGAEVGLKAMQSVQNIAVINGRPSIWGDAMLALVQASGLLKSHKEYFKPDGTAVCEVARKGDVDEDGKQVVHKVEFSDKDVQTAGLRDKGVHKTYPQRMKQMRARGFALRDKFADVLKGLITREEAIDMTPPATAKQSWTSPHEVPDDLPTGEGEATLVLTPDPQPNGKYISAQDAQDLRGQFEKTFGSLEMLPMFVKSLTGRRTSKVEELHLDEIPKFVAELAAEAPKDEGEEI